MADVLERADAPTAAGMAQDKLKVIDCDIHPSLHTRADLYPFLAKRWQRHLETYGGHLRTPFTSTTPYPRSSPLLARRDAWPPSGGPPGSNLAFMRQQHLDPINIEFGMLQVLDLLVSRSRTRNSAVRCSVPSTIGSSNAGLDPSRGSSRRSWSARIMSKRRWRRSSAAPQPATTSRSTFRRAPMSRSGGVAIGRSTPPPRPPTCRSASTLAATAATPQPVAAGPPITTRSTTPTRTRWRPSSRA